eukprot:5502605-Prymnesium_polylepis.1
MGMRSTGVWIGRAGGRAPPGTAQSAALFGTLLFPKFVTNVVPTNDFLMRLLPHSFASPNQCNLAIDYLVLGVREC